jgi:alkanesulfonate monooxygenase SsuD/methylene tetrahydromethanopterin reductase-like flavin-dependent oxidoreductase (luciferase family)
LNIICPTVEITDDRRAAAERMAANLPVTAEDVLDSPVVLIGSVDEIAETLQERRERYGFSYIVVLEPAVDAFAPVVERLTGR